MSSGIIISRIKDEVDQLIYKPQHSTKLKFFVWENDFEKGLKNAENRNINSIDKSSKSPKSKLKIIVDISPARGKNDSAVNLSAHQVTNKSKINFVNYLKNNNFSPNIYHRNSRLHSGSYDNRDKNRSFHSNPSHSYSPERSKNNIDISHNNILNSKEKISVGLHKLRETIFTQKITFPNITKNKLFLSNMHCSNNLTSFKNKPILNIITSNNVDSDPNSILRTNYKSPKIFPIIRNPFSSTNMSSEKKNRKSFNLSANKNLWPNNPHFFISTYTRNMLNENTNIRSLNILSEKYNKGDGIINNGSAFPPNEPLNLEINHQKKNSNNFYQSFIIKENLEPEQELIKRELNQNDCSIFKNYYCQQEKRKNLNLQNTSNNFDSPQKKIESMETTEKYFNKSPYKRRTNNNYFKTNVIKSNGLFNREINYLDQGLINKNDIYKLNDKFNTVIKLPKIVN